MTNKYPLLTVKNIRYWYWNHSPPLSQRDIAKLVGCSPGHLCQFMKRNNIPSRDHSEAGKNIYLCPPKKARHHEKTHSKEYIERREEKRRDYWSDKTRSDSHRDKIANHNKIHFGHVQYQTLQALEQLGSSFLSDLRKYKGLIGTGKENLLSSIQKMLSRNLLTRSIKRNPEAKLKMNFFQYEYSLTDLGKETLNKIKKGDFIVRKVPTSTIKSKIIIGRNQKEMLKILQKKGPMFMDEIYPLVQHLNKNIDQLRDGLLRLTKKGIVIRTKQYNPKSPTNFKYHFKYSINEKS